MATRAASTNPFPEVLLSEVAAPSAAPTGKVRLYAKSDGLLYWKDDAGTEYPVGADITSHTGDTTDAHDASAISAVTSGYGNSSGDDVQEVLDDFDAAITAASGGGGGGGSALWEPNLGDSTGWTNVGSSPTVSFGGTVADMCYIEKTPANTTTDAYFGAYRSWTPSAGQKRRALIASHKINSTLQAVGMFVADSASGKALLWEVYGDNAGGGTSRLHWRSMSSLTGSVNDADTTVVGGFESSSPNDGYWGPVFLEIEYTSATSYQLRFSLDGFLFRTVVTNKAPDSAFTPNSWGIHVYTYGSTTPPQGLFQRYQEL